MYQKNHQKNEKIMKTFLAYNNDFASNFFTPKTYFMAKGY